MPTVNKEKFTECVPSELSLFELPPRQTAVSYIYIQEIRPLSHLSGDGSIELRISGQNSLDYMDLTGSQIYFKLKVKKANESNLAGTEKIDPNNLFLQVFFFFSTEVTFQK